MLKSSMSKLTPKDIYIPLCLYFNARQLTNIQKEHTNLHSIMSLF